MSTKVAKAHAWQELSSCISALNAGGYDMDDNTGQNTAQHLDMENEEIRNMRRDLERQSGGVNPKDKIKDFEDMQACAKSAMGADGDIFQWACTHGRLREECQKCRPPGDDTAEGSSEANGLVHQASTMVMVTKAIATKVGVSMLLQGERLTRTTETDWHTKDPHCWDNFQLRRHLSRIMLGTVEDVLHEDEDSAAKRSFESEMSFFTSHAEKKSVVLGKRRSAQHCRAIISGLCSVHRAVSESESDRVDRNLRMEISELTVASMNGALLMSKRKRPTEDNQEPDSDEAPNQELQAQLAFACGAVQTVIQCIGDERAEHRFMSRVVRLAALLLDGGNMRVQDEFKRVEERDCSFNGRSNFLLQVQSWIRSLVSGATVADTKIAVRMLRMLQLLCEGHNRWWQDEMHGQRNSNCRQKADLVHLCAQIFSIHAIDLRNRMPSVSKLKSLTGNDPRLMQALADLDMLHQLCCTLVEFCQGPCVSNQLTAIEAHCVSVTPNLLWWLTRRQMMLINSSDKGLTPTNIQNRAKRLQGFREAESGVVDLLLSVVEGSTSTAVDPAVHALHKPLVGHPLGAHTNGIDVLMANMNLHGAHSLHARRRKRQTRVGEDSTAIAQTADEKRSIPYYILLQNLSLKHEAVRKQFEKWKPPKDNVMFARRASFIRRASSVSLSGSDPATVHKAEDVLADTAGAVQQIEVVNKDGALETIFFEVPASCAQQEHSPYVRMFLDKMENDLCRDNPRARVRDLLAKFVDYKQMHAHQAWISQWRLLNFLQSVALKTKIMTIWNTLIINAVLLFGINESFARFIVEPVEYRWPREYFGLSITDHQFKDSLRALSGVLAWAHVLCAMARLPLPFSSSQNR